MKRIFMALVLVALLFAMCGFAVFAESEIDVSQKVETHGNVTVFEAVSNYADAYDGEGHIPLISVARTSAEVSAVLDLLFVNADDMAFEIKSITGEYKKLSDNKGNKLVLDAKTTLAVIYDDNTGLLRYYINGRVAYHGEDIEALAHVATAYNSFYLFDCDSESISINEALLRDTNIYNLTSSGTAEIVAFQEYDLENKIRLLAGVDMPWYSAVGFSVQVFEDGVSKSEKHVSSTAIFDSVVADERTVYASDYGYEYFAALEISDVSLNGEKEYYVVARPYTDVGGVKHYGMAVKINVDKEGYIFDKSCVVKNGNDNVFSCSDGVLISKGAFLMSENSSYVSIEANCYGKVYLDVSAVSDSVLNVYADNVLVNTLSLTAGRNNVPIASLEQGKHTVKVEKCDGEYTKIHSVTYFEVPHTHTVSETAEWTMADGAFYTVCAECGNEVEMSESDTPSFLLTFDRSVAEEAAEYEGFNVVFPDKYTLGTDSDGDKALVAGTNYFYVDAEQSKLASMPFYTVSFDLTVSQEGEAGMEISLFTLISNYRNGTNVANTSADYAYFFKYIQKSSKLSTIKISGATNKLNDRNSISIELGEQYKITAIVNTLACSAHVFVDGKYIGKSQKALVDVTSSTVVYPSFKFNDGGNCYPNFDNFKITELK